MTTLKEEQGREEFSNRQEIINELLDAIFEADEEWIERILLKVEDYSEEYFKPLYKKIDDSFYTTFGREIEGFQERLYDFLASTWGVWLEKEEREKNVEWISLHVALGATDFSIFGMYSVEESIPFRMSTLVEIVRSNALRGVYH